MNAKSRNAIALLAVSMLVGACASGPEIRANANPGANLASYKTFGFFYPLATDKNSYSTILTSHLKDATRRELEKRGYQYVTSDPQLLVNFAANVSQQADVRSTPAAGGYYGYRAGMYGTWAGYPQDVETVHYKEGTLSIDLIDAEKKQLVWQGLAEARITKAMTDNPGAAIDKVVTEIFTKYPVGGTAPPPSDSAR